MAGQPDVNEDYRYRTEPAQHQNEIKSGVAEYHKIFVENMDDRVIDEEETKDKKDHPPLPFVEYAFYLFHNLALWFWRLVS